MKTVKVQILKVDLIEKYKDTDIKEKFKSYAQFREDMGFPFLQSAHGLKVGDMIKFWGGYDGNIEFTSEILGFSDTGFIYVLWDCYWNAISVERIIKEENHENIRLRKINSKY